MSLEDERKATETIEDAKVWPPFWTRLPEATARAVRGQAQLEGVYYQVWVRDALEEILERDAPGRIGEAQKAIDDVEAEEGGQND